MKRLLVSLLFTTNLRRFLCSEASTIAPKSTTQVKHVMEHWINLFKLENIPEPVSGVEHIMAHVLGSNRPSYVYDNTEKYLSPDRMQKLEKLCRCRLSRMPVQYIINEWDFRRLTLHMTPPVFIPRTETEALIDIIIDRYKKQPFNTFLEVGCGTGAITLSLLTELPLINAGVAVDRSYLACMLTYQNSQLHPSLANKLIIINAELHENGTLIEFDNKTDVIGNQKFQMIVSNPPYIPTNNIQNLDPEIKLYEDIKALDGGPDGMNVIKSLMILASKSLVTNGYLFIEIDVSQPDLIKQWLIDNYDEYKLKLVKVHKDMYDRDRFVEIVFEGVCSI